MATASIDALIIAIVLGLGYVGAPIWAWAILGIATLAWLSIPLPALVAFALVAVIFSVPAFRRELVTRWVLKLIQRLRLLPSLSATEREALLAGDSWIERELFSGNPDLRRLLSGPFPKLSERERAFLEGPTNSACASLTDWDAWERHDLPPQTWAALKRDGFFGMIIDSKYGGLELSPLAHSEVIQRLASRSSALAITAMVPNSLGPAKLLLHYGTPAQKDYYLPRLARAEEIPCFALTEPDAGSDAAAIHAEGVLFREPGGELRIRLNWHKRYTTLAPIATLIGLAFKLRDPERLLGGERELGITCALVPANAPGVLIDRRHDPMGVPFLNAPNRGENVVIPADAIIGGLEHAGHGWTMLMQCLADGRGISLPAESTGTAKFVSRVASAYAATREQFGVAIGQFEGVAERLARMGTAVYAMDSARRFLCGALGAGLRPAVATAIAKVELTELGRLVINDGMDVLGGNGVVLGPKNLIATSYIGAPIGITVEGANIMTRALIIFGQGAIRCHPFALKEIDAAEKNDLSAFDRAFWGHVIHVIRSATRALLLGISHGWIVELSRHPLARYRRRLLWASASFAIWSELAMLSLGGSLKRREKLTGRLADALAWMVLAASILRRFDAEGRRAEDRIFAASALDLAFRRIGTALGGLRANLRVILLGWALPGSGIATPLSDKLDLEIARRMLEPGDQRDRIFGGIYLPPDADDPFARLERALRVTSVSRPANEKIRRAIKRGILHRATPETIGAEACAAGVITDLELKAIVEAKILREKIVQVDDFSIRNFAVERVKAA